MANLVINRILDSRFEFSLDGGLPISDNAPNLTTFGNICHFKTKNGANIIKNQNIDYSEITVIDTFGGSGTFTFPNIQAVWTKLIELNFFLGVSGSGGGGGGVTRFDALLDSFTYFGEDGKVPVVDEAQLRLVPTEFYNVKDFVDLSDVGFTTLIAGKVLSVANVGGVPKIVLSDPSSGGGGVSSGNSAVGGFYYADLTTQTTPLSYVSGELQLTNDIGGSETFLSKPPYGITSVWDEGLGVFNFSQLSIGDEVFIRADLNFTTNSIDQFVELKIVLGEGSANEKTINLGIYSIENIGEILLNGSVNFGINNEDWRTTDAKLYFSSSDIGSIKVVGFDVYIVRKSINIIDISDENFRTFSVNKKQSPLTDATTLEQTVKVGYDGGNKVTNILFDKAFSKYLSGYASTSKKLELTIYNKTKNTTSIAEILSLAYSDGSSQYYVVSVENIIEQSAISVNDNFEIQISAYQIGGGVDISTKTDKGGYQGTAQDIVDLMPDLANEIVTADNKPIPEDADRVGFWDSATGLLVNSSLAQWADYFASKISLTWATITGNQKDVNLVGFTDGHGPFMGTETFVNNVSITDVFRDESTGFYYGKGTVVQGVKPFLRSVDGQNWNVVHTYPDDKRFIFGGANGVIIGIIKSVGGDGLTTSTLKTSTDNGVTWASEEVYRSIWSSVKYVNGNYVIYGLNFFGQNNRILTSTDGVNWSQPIVLPYAGPQDHFVYGNGIYVIGGTGMNGSTYATSPDLVNWTQRSHFAGGMKNLQFTDGIFLVVNPNESTISTDGINWTLVPGLNGGD